MRSRTGLRRRELQERGSTYAAVGATQPDAARWSPPDGYRSAERTARLGEGEACWRAASTAVLAWGVKTRSGFAVEPAVPPGGAVRAGERYWLLARVGPVRLREPVQVVTVVTEADRHGFAYGTLEGHPVSGEEAFVVSRAADGGVWLTVRSLTRPGRGRWRLVFPAALAAQPRYRARYLRALLRQG